MVGWIVLIGVVLAVVVGVLVYERVSARPAKSRRTGLAAAEPGVTSGLDVIVRALRRLLGG